MTVLYQNQCYNEVCYKGTALYLICHDNCTISDYRLTLEHLQYFFNPILCSLVKTKIIGPS